MENLINKDDIINSIDIISCLPINENNEKNFENTRFKLKNYNCIGCIDKDKYITDFFNHRYRNYIFLITSGKFGKNIDEVIQFQNQQDKIIHVSIFCEDVNKNKEWSKQLKNVEVSDQYKMIEQNLIGSIKQFYKNKIYSLYINRNFQKALIFFECFDELIELDKLEKIQNIGDSLDQNNYINNQSQNAEIEKLYEIKGDCYFIERDYYNSVLYYKRSLYIKYKTNICREDILKKINMCYDKQK